MDERQKLLAKAVVFLVKTKGESTDEDRIEFLKSKGLTDDEIERAVAAAADWAVVNVTIDAMEKAKKQNIH